MVLGQFEGESESADTLLNCPNQSLNSCMQFGWKSVMAHTGGL